MSVSSNRTMGRRSFLKGAAIAGASIVGSAALVGCDVSNDSQQAQGGAANVANDPAEEIVRHADGWVDTPNTAPIPPVDPPATYDVEVDVVVVGTGGGGCLSAYALAESGLKVAILEKADQVGGSTSQGSVFIAYGGMPCVYGDNWGSISDPYDPDAVVDYFTNRVSHQCDKSLIRAMAVAAPNAVQKLFDAGVEMVDMMYIYDPNARTGVLKPKEYCNTKGMVFEYVCDKLIDSAVKMGAELYCLTPAEALIVENGRVVGVMATSGETGETMAFHAKKAVVLTAGGIACNRDMLKRYIPYIGQGASTCTLMPTTTGECIRMGLGLNAGITGQHTFSMRDGGIAHPNGSFVYRSMWDGGEALCRQPWLAFNIRGERLRYFTTDTENEVEIGDAEKYTCLTDLSTFGHRRVVVFDGNYEDHVKHFNEQGARPLNDPNGKSSLTDNMLTAMSLVDQDWRDGLQRGLDGGYIMKADTLEELADLLEVDREVMASSVEAWNKTCDEGEPFEAYGYKPEWKIKIQTPPFYGAKTGAAVQGTGAGLLVNPSMQVLTESSEVIPGLYAGFQTAGGWGGFNYNDSGAFGNVGASFVGGYMAYEGVMSNEM